MALSQPESPLPSSRLVSLDALRGFDLFWILGADALVRALRGMNPSAPVRLLAEQLDHRVWAGFTFYDLIFPLFVFIGGVSLVFSLTQLVEREGRQAALKRILRRALLLFLLGVFNNGGLAQPWPDVRLAGVLQRIALAYAAAGILFVCFRPRTLALTAFALLVGYWGLLALIPIRDFRLEPASLVSRLGVAEPSRDQVRHAFHATSSRVYGMYEPGLNLTNHLDFQYLPGAHYDVYYDPEGLLSTVPAVATCLAGVFAGLLLRRADLGAREKAAWLAAAGLAALALGWAWHPLFPVVKKLWTSSFVLVAGGWSLLLLSGFYYVIDVRQWRRWCTPFVWIGMNPITLYVAASFVDWAGLGSRLVGGSIAASVDRYAGAGAGRLLVTAAGLGLVFLVARYLHQKRIFLRV